MPFIKFFGKSNKRDWKVTVNGNGMIRVCQKSGLMELRDSKNNQWIGFSNKKELDELREKLLKQDISRLTSIWK